MITAIISISFHNQHDEECHSLHFKLQINWHMFPSHKKTEKNNQFFYAYGANGVSL